MRAPLFLALAAACTFDSSGIESGTGTSGGTDSTATGSATTAASDASSTSAANTDTAGSSTGGSSGGCTPTNWYPDTDGDLHGDRNAAPVSACEAPPGHVPVNDDCDDTTAAVHPDHPEICDQLDNDCDGAVNEGAETNMACGNCTYAKWDQAPGQYYIYCTNLRDWPMARMRCEQMGGDLVVINDQGENDFLANLTDEPAWIGFSDRAMEGTWVWVDGSPQTYENWEFLEPNDGALGGEDCAVLRNAGTWNDRECLLQRAFLCEQPR